MPSHACPQIHDKALAAARDIDVDFGPHLRNGVLLTGTPTVTEATGTFTGLTASVNSTATTINNRSVIAYQSVRFRVPKNVGTAGTTYEFNIVAVGDNGEEFPAKVFLKLVAT